METLFFGQIYWPCTSLISLGYSISDVADSQIEVVSKRGIWWLCDVEGAGAGGKGSHLSLLIRWVFGIEKYRCALTLH